MFLTQLTDREIIVGKTQKGVCQGVGISLKTQAVKYLLCASSSTSRARFAVPVSAVEGVGEQIVLSRLRPVFPKNCACLFLHLPVYGFDGAFLGEVLNLELKDFIATNLITSEGEYPANAITACADAVLLKKEQPFPIGQRIPAPMLSLVTDKKDSVVTKPILRTAIEKRALIGFTLSLPPFALDLDPPRSR